MNKFTRLMLAMLMAMLGVVSANADNIKVTIKANPEHITEMWCAKGTSFTTPATLATLQQVDFSLEGVENELKYEKVIPTNPTSASTTMIYFFFKLEDGYVVRTSVTNANGAKMGPLPSCKAMNDNDLKKYADYLPKCNYIGYAYAELKVGDEKVDNKVFEFTTYTTAEAPEAAFKVNIDGDPDKVNLQLAIKAGSFEDYTNLRAGENIIPLASTTAGSDWYSMKVKPTSGLEFPIFLKNGSKITVATDTDGSKYYSINGLKEEMTFYIKTDYQEEDAIVTVIVNERDDLDCSDFIKAVYIVDTVNGTDVETELEGWQDMNYVYPVAPGKRIKVVGDGDKYIVRESYLNDKKDVYPQAIMGGIIKEDATIRYEVIKANRDKTLSVHFSSDLKDFLLQTGVANNFSAINNDATIEWGNCDLGTGTIAGNRNTFKFNSTLDKDDDTVMRLGYVTRGGKKILWDADFGDFEIAPEDGDHYDIELNNAYTVTLDVDSGPDMTSFTRSDCDEVNEDIKTVYYPKGSTLSFSFDGKARVKSNGSVITPNGEDVYTVTVNGNTKIEAEAVYDVTISFKGLSANVSVNDQSKAFATKMDMELNLMDEIKIVPVGVSDKATVVVTCKADDDEEEVEPKEDGSYVIPVWGDTEISVVATEPAIPQYKLTFEVPEKLANVVSAFYFDEEDDYHAINVAETTSLPMGTVVMLTAPTAKNIESVVVNNEALAYDASLSEGYTWTFQMGDNTNVVITYKQAIIEVDPLDMSVIEEGEEGPAIDPAPGVAEYDSEGFTMGMLIKGTWVLADEDSEGFEVTLTEKESGTIYTGTMAPYTMWSMYDAEGEEGDDEEGEPAGVEEEMPEFTSFMAMFTEPLAPGTYTFAMPASVLTNADGDLNAAWTYKDMYTINGTEMYIDGAFTAEAKAYILRFVVKPEDAKVIYTFKSEAGLTEDAIDELADPVMYDEGTEVWDGEPLSFNHAFALKAVAQAPGCAPSPVQSLYIEDTIATGVAALEAENGEAVYYTLDGVVVPAKNLAPGLYIRVRGGETSKVLVK